MKKPIILILISTFLIFNSFAQAPPEGINYQAVARNSTGNALANTSLDIHFIIRNGSTTVYEETHKDTTNIYGLFTAVIGQGLPSAGPFSAIDWTTGPKFLEVLVNDGSGYVSMGTTQMMSVPYALYAKTSGNSGTPGKDGLRILNDTIDPVAANGVDGEFFINTNTNKIFGPKNGTWPAGVSLVGPAGAPGAANINGTAGHIIKFTTSTSGDDSQLFEDAANNIGIGTITPGAKLDVTGAGKFSNALTVGAYTLPATDGTPNQLLKTNGGGILTWSPDNNTTYTNGPGLDLTANTFSLTATGVTPGTYGSATQVARFKVDAQGRLTAADSVPITIAGTLPLGTTGQTLYNNGTTWQATSNLFNDGTNIGIGTTTPTPGSTLDVAGKTTTKKFQMTNGPVIAGDVLIAIDSLGNAKWQTPPAAGSAWSIKGNTGTNPGPDFIGTTDLRHLVFKTNSLERMRIDSLGNVAIGTKLPPPTGIKLDVANGSIRATDTLKTSVSANSIGNGSSSSLNLGINDILGTPRVWSIINSGVNGGMLKIQDATIDRMTIDTSGTVRIGALGALAVKLEVNGKVKIVDGGILAAGKVLTSDANGVGTWQLPPAAWMLNGNAGTNPGADFIGTTDSRDFILKVNSKSIIRLNSNNSVFINTNSLTNPGVTISGGNNPLARTLNLQADTAQTNPGPLGIVSFSDAGNAVNQAKIVGERDAVGGTPGDLPTALVFFTTPDNDGGPGREVERMRISNTGNVSIGGAPAKNKLTVKGSMAVSRVTASGSPYLITSNDYIVEFGAGGATSATLPSSSSVDDGTMLILRNRTSGPITVNVSGGIDTVLKVGASATTTTSTIANFAVLRLYLSGNAWVEW